MTNMTSPNPWQSLRPLYVLPEDFAAIVNHRNYSNLRLDTLPGQFVGGFNTSEVIFLLLNPGFDERDITVDLAIPAFIEDNRRNHIDPYDSSFYYLDDNYHLTGSYRWWTRILGTLLRDGVTSAMLRSKIMAIEYFPYHSKDWRKLPEVPSQKVAFDLVNEAISRGKTVVITRSEGLWYDAVPALKDYKNKMIIKNPRQPYISPNNLGEANYNTIKNLITGVTK